MSTLAEEYYEYKGDALHSEAGPVEYTQWLEAKVDATRKQCRWGWFHEWMQYWQTDCGKVWSDDSMSGMQTGKSLKYCPYCGRLIEHTERETRNDKVNS